MSTARGAERVVNVAFSGAGLTACGIGNDVVRTFAPEFLQGMRRRALINGDEGPSDPSRWDQVWHQEVHVLLAVYAANRADLDAYQEELVARLGGSALIAGKQEATALFAGIAGRYDRRRGAATGQRYGHRAFRFP